MKTVNLAYIRDLYNYLVGMDEEWLENSFNMNNPSDRAMFFDEAKRTFQAAGPKTQLRTIEAMEFILSEPDIKSYWHRVIPHDFPATVFNIKTDKKEYLRNFFRAVAGREPKEDMNTQNVTVLIVHEPNWHPSE
jgi:hypothetical protein